jgi:hypothetical protein
MIFCMMHPRKFYEFTSLSICQPEQFGHRRFPVAATSAKTSVSIVWIKAHVSTPADLCRRTTAGTASFTAASAANSASISFPYQLEQLCHSVDLAVQIIEHFAALGTDFGKQRVRATNLVL